MKYKLTLKDIFFIEWMITVFFVFFVQVYVGNNLGILIAVLMIPMFIHDILLIIIDYKEVKHNGTTKNMDRR